MSDTAAEAPNLDELKRLAIERSISLSQQLNADRADLLQLQDRRETPAIGTGIDAIARAIQAADRLHIQLKGE